MASVWLHPRAPAWYLVEEVDRWTLTPEQVAALGSEVVWIDARPTAKYEEDHLPGALLLNDDEWGDLMFEQQDALQAAMGKPVVVYCDGVRCKRSKVIAEKLRQFVGLDPVYILRGDWRPFKGDQ